MRARDQVFVSAAGLLGPLWIRHRRGMYRGIGQNIAGEQRATLARYFSGPTLACARVATVDHIEEPVVFGLMRALALTVPVEMDGVQGMAFGDAIVLTRGSGLSILFHELVHVEQYRRLGLGGFAREYVRGWIETGSYRGIPLERQAYALQRRFECGEEFAVEEVTESER